MNKENFDAIVAGTRADRSQTGNKSCIRNEFHNTVKFTWDPLWQLPKDGRFEFDFIFFGNKPLEAEETKDFAKVIDWFKQREWSHAAHKNQPTETSDNEGNANANARATPD